MPILKPPAADNQRAVIGDNAPPPTALEAIAADIGDLADLARDTLTGEPLANEAQASAVQSLVAQARSSVAAAEKARVADKEPHLAAGRAVDASYKPLMADAERVRDAGLVALAPWLQAVETEQRAVAKQLADDAAAALEAAQAISRATDPANLDQVEAREAAIKASARATMDAIAADKAKPVAKSGLGRGVGLRSVWVGTLVEAHVYLAHVRSTNPMRLKAALVEMMAQDVSGGARALPGCDIVETKVAR